MAMEKYFHSLLVSSVWLSGKNKVQGRGFKEEDLPLQMALFI